MAEAVIVTIYENLEIKCTYLFIFLPLRLIIYSVL